MNISVTIQYFDLQCSVCIPHILLEQILYHDFGLGPSYQFIKRATFGASFPHKFLHFYEIGTRTYIRMLRHIPLHMNLKNRYFKYERFMCNID